MTDDEIIELWAQANKLAGIKHPHTFDELKEFAQLVAAAEREACAKIVENYTGAWDDEGYALVMVIRNRSNT